MSQSPKDRIPDEEENTEPPLTMAASVILTNLTRDASKALEEAGESLVQKKGEVCYSRQATAIAVHHESVHLSQTISAEAIYFSDATRALPSHYHNLLHIFSL